MAAKKNAPAVVAKLDRETMTWRDGKGRYVTPKVTPVKKPKPPQQ